MAAYEPKKLYRGQPGATATTLYTVPVAKSCILKQVMVHNPTAGAVTIALNDVASGDTASDANQFFEALLAAGELVVLDLSDVLETGDFLSATASAAASITLIISGQVTV